MNALVIGGTGWVGHHIVKALTAIGCDVTICTRGQKQTYRNDIGSNYQFVTADKADEAAMADALKTKYDIIVDSVPSEKGIDNIVKHARGLKHYLHCSSTGGYAPLPFLPGDETMPYDHFMGGWQQKQIVDAKVLDLHARQGFPATVIRPSYITGPGLLPLDNFGGRREDFIADILAERPLELPNDGQALLQPIHVRDLATMFALAVQQPRSIGQIYNASLAKAVTLERYLQITAATFDKKVTIELHPIDDILERHGDAIQERGLRFLATHMCYDISKPREQLGFSPSITTEDAIEETARWASEQG